MSEDVVVFDDNSLELLEQLASEDCVTVEVELGKLIDNFFARGGYPPVFGNSNP